MSFFAESVGVDDSKPVLEPWRIAIIDDEPSVHEVTKLSLRSLKLDDRSVEFFSAYTGEEGFELLKNTKDIALVFVDVVMETEDAGLKLIERIRNELKNNSIRLVLRTGQPGQAPEEDIIRDYEINDYKAKTELTSTKLKSCVYTALRSYRDLKTIEHSLKSMEEVIRSSSSVLKSGTLFQFGSAVLQQVMSLLNMEHSAIYLSNQHTDMYGNTASMLLAATGELVSYGHHGEEIKLPEHIQLEIDKVIAAQESFQSEAVFIGFYPSGNRNNNVLYLQLSGELTKLQMTVLELFATNVSLVFENLTQKEDIQNTQKELIMVLSDAIELRSKETGGHVRRVALMCELLAEKTGQNEEFIDVMRYASALHDVGKVSIPETILHKPGKLDPFEWEIMQTHAMRGYDLLKNSDRVIAKMGAIIAKTHHEHWNGKGYPDGISGTDIPVEGRIMAIIDVLDALLSRRCYKEPWPPEDVKAYLIEQKGRQFDPDITQAVLDSFDELLALRERHPDE